jgi:hypothetical protein
MFCGFYGRFGMFYKEKSGIPSQETQRVTIFFSMGIFWQTMDTFID